MSTILSLFGGGNGIFAVLGGAILAALLAYMKGRTSGAQRERDKRAREEAAARTEGQRIEDAVAGRDPDDNRERLGKWARR